jgi:hypothetical protein
MATSSRCTGLKSNVQLRPTTKFKFKFGFCSFEVMLSACGLCEANMPLRRALHLLPDGQRPRNRMAQRATQQTNLLKASPVRHTVRAERQLPSHEEQVHYRDIQAFQRCLGSRSKHRQLGQCGQCGCVRTKQHLRFRRLTTSGGLLP